VVHFYVETFLTHLFRQILPKILIFYSNKILDFERSIECIDFAMMCVIFGVSVYTIYRRRNALIFKTSTYLLVESQSNWYLLLGGKN